MSVRFLLVNFCYLEIISDLATSDDFLFSFSAQFDFFSSTNFQSMEFLCDYYQNTKIDGLYTCRVGAAIVTDRSRAKTFIGKHQEHRANYDVRALAFHRAMLYYLPTGLQESFPLLTKLSVNDCKLKEISAEDLVGLDNLEYLLMTFGCLSYLPDDLLINMTKLKGISFYGNKLGVLTSKLLDPIAESQLEFVDFRKNDTVNVVYNQAWKSSLKSLQDLKYVIDLLCSPSMPKGTFNNFKNLWDEHDFRDFSFIIGEKEIRVHKNVVAVQSSVFAEILENDEKVRNLNKLEVEDCREEIFVEFLRLLYTAEIRSKEDSFEIFSLAWMFDVTELKGAYMDIITSDLNELNVFCCLAMGNYYKCDAMVEAAFAKVKSLYPEETIHENLKHEPEKLHDFIALAIANNEACRLSRFAKDTNKERFYVGDW